MLDSSVDTSSAPVAFIYSNDQTTDQLETTIDEILDEIIDPLCSSSRTSTPTPAQTTQPLQKDIEVKIKCWGASYEVHAPPSKNDPCCIFCCCICYK